MNGMYDFSSRGFACLASALVILCVLAMPTQGVMANDPSGGGGDGKHGVCPQGCFPPFCLDCDCEYPDGYICCCNYACVCP